mgnify:CR=1 FL=1
MGLGVERLHLGNSEESKGHEGVNTCVNNVSVVAQCILVDVMGRL